MSNQWSRQLSAAIFFSACLIPVSHANVPVEQGNLSGGPAQGSTVWQMYQQMQDMQDEIRKLRGQIEDQQNTIDKTQNELKNRYTDLDQRLDSMSPDHKNDNTSTATPSPNNVPSNAAPADANNNNNASSSLSPISGTPLVKGDKAPDTAPTTSDTDPDAKTGKTNNTTDNKPADNQNTATSTNQSDKDAYIGAYEAYKSGGADKAIEPMQQFISTYPNSVFVPNAYYWLGEFYLSSSAADYNKAKQNFATVINKYPKSAKAPTALYRLATISEEVDHRPTEAVALMKKLTMNYPESQEAIMAKTFIKTHSKS